VNDSRMNFVITTNATGGERGGGERTGGGGMAVARRMPERGRRDETTGQHAQLSAFGGGCVATGSGFAPLPAAVRARSRG